MTSEREALLNIWKQNDKRSPLDPTGFHDGSSLVCCCLLLAAAGVPPIAVQTIGGTLSLLLPCCSLSHPQLEPNWLHLGSKMGVQRAPNSIWTRFPKKAPNLSNFCSTWVAQNTIYGSILGPFGVPCWPPKRFILNSLFERYF